MENKSVWSKYLKNKYVKLEDDFTCDILIIGGGLAGVLTSFYLENNNLKIALVERNTIGSGITSKMTGKATILQDTLTKIDTNNLELYLKSQLDALKLLKKNINNYNINCDFNKNDGYLYTTKKSNIQKLVKLAKSFDRLNIKYYLNDLKINNLDNLFSIRIDDTYVINPILYLNNLVPLCHNTSFYENTNIVEVIKENDYFIAKTFDNKKIIAKKVIFATNYPYFLKPLFFPLKVRLEKSYIGYGNYTNLLNNNFNLINIDKKVTSIRFYKDKILYLGLSKIISSKVNDNNCFKLLKNNSFITKYDNIWSNIDLITNDNLPLIGEVFKDMYIITGFNTWGILNSHIGSKLLSDLILKRKNKYKELFNPRRKITIQKVLNSSLNIFENMKGFAKGYLYKNEAVFYSKEEAIYVNNGKHYTVKRKCPHLKCNLIFNEVEKTWDCPCHASRFDIEGNVIAGPSKYDIKVDVK